jgi:hypothetical protein
VESIEFRGIKVTRTILTKESLADTSLSGPTQLQRDLAAKLLAHGGERVVVLGDEPHAEQIVRRGQLFTQKVVMVPGEEHECHANAAALWSLDILRHTLVTGFVLGGDVWAQHSWVAAGKRLYETIVKMQKYFGVPLDMREAVRFFTLEFLSTRYRKMVALVAASVKVPDFTCQGNDVQAGQGGTDPGVPTKTGRPRPRSRKDTGKDRAK